MSLNSAIYHRRDVDSESLGLSRNLESHVPSTTGRLGPENLTPGIQDHTDAGNIAVGKDNIRRGVLIDWDPHVARLPASPCRKWRNQALEFTSAERLMEPSIFLRGLLRDDIESFVYVLVYHVLRYRPAGFPSAALAHHLHHIFNQHIVVDGQYSGGEWKADYLRGGSYFTPTALIDSTLPSQLVALMNALRYLFFFTYTSNAVLRMMRIPTSIVEKGLRVLDTADEVTAIFEAHLKLDGWPEDDGADDQLRSFDPTKTTGRRFVWRFDY